VSAPMADLARVVDVGLTVFTRRFMTLLALTLTFALFSWAMILGTVLGVIIAGAFALIVFLPILAVDRHREAAWQSEPAQSD
jgi:hypothetical protein